MFINVVNVHRIILVLFLLFLLFINKNSIIIFSEENVHQNGIPIRTAPFKIYIFLLLMFKTN